MVNISFPRVHRGRINNAGMCFMGSHRHPPWQTLSSPALSIAHSAVFMGWQQVPLRGITVQTKGVERLCCNQHRIRERDIDEKTSRFHKGQWSSKYWWDIRRSRFVCYVIAFLPISKIGCVFLYFGIETVAVKQGGSVKDKLRWNKGRKQERKK